MSVEQEVHENAFGEPSEIRKFYEGLSIFITGGSGFLGNLLIQKLIRECPISKMYILIRPKKGKSPQERVDQMLKDPVFDKMKTQCPNYINMIHFVEGDIQKPGLGLSEEDKKCLSENVNVVFHLAATVRFDEKIKKAALVNLGGSKELLKLAKTYTNLKAFVHCSTAYSHYPQNVIDEITYDVPYSADKLLHIVNKLNDEELECLTQKIIKTWPNTYSFTKALTENVMKEEGKGMPITIVRPGVVTPAATDPLEGWINNFYGPIGLTCANVYGVLRIGHVIGEVNCNFIPGDYTINNMIVAAQYIGTTFNQKMSEGMKPVDDIPIFNCVSQTENPLTYEEYKNMNSKCEHWTPIDVLWYSVMIYCANPYVFKFLQIFLEIIPAHLMDCLLVFKGEKPMVAKIVAKIHSLQFMCTPFTLRDWIFLNFNNQKLWNRLNSTDKSLFQFDVKNINWDYYFQEQYSKGLYLYCVKKDLKDLPRAQIRHRKLKYLHYTVVYSFYILCALIIFKLFTAFV